MLDFTDIYDEHLRRVYAFIAYRVPTRADAEDLTQQTFELAFANRAKYDQRLGSITTWLLTIARNLLIDQYRARSSRGDAVRIHEIAGDLEGSQACVPEPELGISPELGAALAALGDRERELIALRFGADLSGPQIAKITGLSLANVQQLQSRAMRRLRELLDEGPLAELHSTIAPQAQRRHRTKLDSD